MFNGSRFYFSLAHIFNLYLRCRLLFFFFHDRCLNSVFKMRKTLIASDAFFPIAGGPFSALSLNLLCFVFAFSVVGTNWFMMRTASDTGLSFNFVVLFITAQFISSRICCSANVTSFEPLVYDNLRRQKIRVVYSFPLVPLLFDGHTLSAPQDLKCFPS